MNKTIVIVVMMCFLFSVTEVMATGTAPRMRRALNRAWKAHLAREKAFERDAARLEKELKNMDRSLLDPEQCDRRTR
jgi:hypothetical protein